MDELVLADGSRYRVDYIEEHEDDSFIDVIVHGSIDEGTEHSATLTLREGDTERRLRGVARAISIEDRDDGTMRTLLELHDAVIEVVVVPTPPTAWEHLLDDDPY